MKTFETQPPAAAPADVKTINMIEAITQALHEEMERDPRIFLIGEDIASYGGVFKATKGLYEKFGPMRVIDSPISENFLVQGAVGAALAGLIPSPEIQFDDFISLAVDGIVEHAAKMRYRSGGMWTCPMVIRCCCGGAVGGGIYHSQFNASWFMHSPGLVVVAPSTPYDAKGLLKSAFRGQNPVLYYEHKRLYRTAKGPVPTHDYTVPLGKANVVRQGRHATVISYALMLHRSLEAAEKLAAEGIEVEVIDLRTLAPYDKETILESVHKTSRALCVYESSRTMGVGAEIAAMIAEEGFSDLDAPVRRVSPPDAPQEPFAPVLADNYLPDANRIAQAIRETVAY
ncbi:MAG TPA: alpha-ketoacid dehydrogenase subunit beta [Candidatus Limnocylindrales bacterium]|nr:alpha-ketoacid dehydrogenase subunit beta [Candidatus Limnocylindrales bacterium]